MVRCKGHYIQVVANVPSLQLHLDLGGALLRQGDSLTSRLEQKMEVEVHRWTQKHQGPSASDLALLLAEISLPSPLVCRTNF